jgi:hypothetical protein
MSRRHLEDQHEIPGRSREALTPSTAPQNPRSLDPDRVLLSPPPCAFGFSFDPNGSTFCVMLTAHQMRHVVKFAISQAQSQPRSTMVLCSKDSPLFLTMENADCG